LRELLSAIDGWTSWAKGPSLPLDRIQTMTDTLENAYGVHAPACEALATSVHHWAYARRIELRLPAPQPGLPTSTSGSACDESQQ
jgi:hypothetical protein